MTYKAILNYILDELYIRKMLTIYETKKIIGVDDVNEIEDENLKIEAYKDIMEYVLKKYKA